MTAESSRPPRVSAFAKVMLGLQAFLLRRNWMGAMGEQLMVVTVTGRKTGKTYSTPIGYLRDGDAIVALSQGSQWYRNALAAGQAVLEIQGGRLLVRAEEVADAAERQRLFALYQRHRGDNFSQYFGVAVDAAPEALEQALATRAFVRFTPLNQQP